LKEKIVKETNSNKELYANEIDFGSIFSILWKRRKLIVFGTIGATLMSIGISFLLPRVYRSEGFYQLGNPTKTTSENEKFINRNASIEKEKPTKKIASVGVPVPLYKSGSSQFFNPNRFLLIASKDKLFKKEDLREIATDFRRTEDINKWIKPVYAFAKEDAREFSQLPQDESNSVIGLSLSYEADSPENASTYVKFFGNYIRDCLLYMTLYNYIMDGYSNTISKTNKNENDIIDIQFEILQNTNKMKDIRAILSTYPESAIIDSRQMVVSVRDGGARFLAPVTQLVGIEATLADLRQDLAAFEREREKLTASAEYYSRCYNELAKISEHGESLFLLLKSIKDEVFKNKDFGKDGVKEVFNNLSIDLQTFDLTFFNNSRFISGPTIPAVHIRPWKILIAIVSFFSSFFLLVILAIVSHWWQGNKKTIM
jgi:LPS O-antigen subunit length determinant protein (WzzB/FepE family)